MVWKVASSAGGTLLRLQCPRCGEVQARSRKPAGTRYRCRKCHALFTREEGAPKGKERGY